MPSDAARTSCAGDPFARPAFRFATRGSMSRMRLSRSNESAVTGSLQPHQVAGPLPTGDHLDAKAWEAPPQRRGDGGNLLARDGVAHHKGDHLCFGDPCPKPDD